MSKKTIQVGLIGFGTIGAGLVKVLEQSSALIRRRLGADIHIARIADLDINTDRGVKIDRSILTTKADDVLDDPGVDIVVELIGGYEPARTFVLKAIRNGKHVVTANKALLAKHGDEIFSALAEKKLSMGFEGSVGGAIPIIRSLKEAFAANPVSVVEGIVNGTCNYILSKMSDENMDFAVALKEAQAKGFAEADPTFDIEGLDSAHKIAILARLAFGSPVSCDDICIQGISGVTSEDIDCAREFGYRIKLLAIAKSDGQTLDIRVHPAMIPVRHPMANINGVLNAIRVCDDYMYENILVGHGAGSMPTGSAVAADVVDIARDILSASAGRVPAQSFHPGGLRPLPVKSINDIESEYFLRFRVVDRPGVLSRISGVLGDNNISILSVIQRGRDHQGGNKGVSLVVMTHRSREKNIRAALEEIDRLDVICEKTHLIRVEN